ncbi:MAG: GTP cyclohydrolase I FolE2 [Ectothiorhodospiraceae bacterium]|nr:GTP cyclohydrolase I FolE2 [Ectothiorhodospiraceae bacterium]
MSKDLPDVARSPLPTAGAPLDWVGMEQIDLLLTLAETESAHPVPARADLFVDLPAAEIRGIHMSRLYRLLDTLSLQESVSPLAIRRLLQEAVASHADCRSTRARLTVTTRLICRRPALETPGLAGWRAYPLRLQAMLDTRQETMDLRAAVDVTYSSTCPCSAALSRRALRDRFQRDFQGSVALEPHAVAAWIEQHGTTATPHSQRSIAELSVRLPCDADTLQLLPLIDRAEAVLATPVQTAVKRADEQAFALLNGGNLMYVEDAARRLRTALAPQFEDLRIRVRHLESLHPHDAVAEV